MRLVAFSYEGRISLNCSFRNEGSRATILRSVDIPGQHRIRQGRAQDTVETYITCNLNRYDKIQPKNAPKRRVERRHCIMLRAMFAGTPPRQSQGRLKHTECVEDIPWFKSTQSAM